MENLDVIVLTVLVVGAFIVFIVTSLKEINRIVDEPYQYEKASGFTRAALFNALSSLFEDDEEIPNEKREKFKSTLKRTIADMETDGIYFDKTAKRNLSKNREDNPSDEETN